MNARQIALVAGGIAFAVVLLLVFRPSDGDQDAAATAPGTTEAPATTAAATQATSPPPTPPAGPKVPVVRIRIEGGALVGGLRQITIERGRTFRLIVTSDLSDHVHVHGLDVFQDVGPGKPARFTLTPTVAGRYEIELEDRHFQIAQLNVEP